MTHLARQLPAERDPVTQPAGELIVGPWKAPEPEPIPEPEPVVEVDPNLCPDCGQHLHTIVVGDLRTGVGRRRSVSCRELAAFRASLGGRR